MAQEPVQAGFLNVYKDAGFTSFDVVAKLRGILHTKKIGHTGTLDPAATGVLPIAIGRATKAIDLLPDHDKAYDAVLRLGLTTDTYDTTGTVIKQREVCVTEAEINSALQTFVGDIDQVPPMYSAKRVNGKRLYELARAGIEVKRQPSRVHVDAISVLETNLPDVKIHVECSKGTYIRSICHDVGELLGCGGCMESLLRTRAGGFTLKDAHHLGEIEAAVAEGQLSRLLLPVDAPFDMFPSVVVREEAVVAAVNGGILSDNQVSPVPNFDTMARLYLPNGNLIGLYKHKDGRFRLEKMLIQ